MTPELRKYYENRFVMFSTDGWKELIEDVSRMKAAIDTLSGTTVENLQFRQGELSAMNWLLSLEQAFEEAYKGLQDESDS